MSWDGIWRRGLVYKADRGTVATVAIMVAAFLLTILLALAIAIAAKPVLEQNSPMTFHITKRRSFANYNVVERDWHRLKSRAGNHDSELTYDRTGFYTSVGIGQPPTTCKWLQYLVTDEEILIMFLLHRPTWG